MEKLFSLPNEKNHMSNEALNHSYKALNSPIGIERSGQYENTRDNSEEPKRYFLYNEDINKPLFERPNQFDHLDEFPEWPKGDVLSTEDLDMPLIKQINQEATALSTEQKENLKEKTGWSDGIVDYIKTEEEAQVYVNANLKEVNGNLERTDIDWNAKIPQNRIDRMRSLYGDEVADRWAEKTNLDLIREGKAPYGSDGQQINLHHIGQKSDSPLAELTNSEHKQNDGVLHDKTKSSEIERPVFRAERQRYWMARYESLTVQK